MNKIYQNFKENKFDYLVLTLIVLLAFVLRTINIEKPEGMWFDEVYCWYIASAKMPLEFLSRIVREDYHAPLYFFILHYWMKLLGSSDVTLRMLSVIFGVLAVPAFFLLGRELQPKTQNEKSPLMAGMGLWMALFVAVNSLLIYYSQEVKFYSLVFLLSTLNLLFMIRFYKSGSKKSAAGIVISTAAILYTLTTSPFYLAFVFLGFALLLWLKKRESFKKFLVISAIIALLYLPYIPVLIHHQILLSSYFINLASVFRFDWVNVLLFVFYLFSPFLSTIKNGVPVPAILETLSGISFGFVVFVIIPALLGIAGIINSIRKKTILNAFLAVSLVFVAATILLAIFGTFGFLPRYVLIGTPILLMAAVFGLCTIKNKTLSRILLSFFVLANLFYVATAPDSAPNLKRDETYGTLNNMLIQENVTRKDTIFCFFAGSMLKKYNNYNVFDFDLGASFIKNKNNALENVLDKNVINKLNQNNVKNLLKTYFLSKNISPRFEKFLYKNIYLKMHSGDKFVVVITKVFFYEDKNVTDEIYEKMIPHALVYSKVSSDVLRFAKKYFVLKSTLQKDFWVVLVFEKV